MVRTFQVQKKKRKESSLTFHSFEAFPNQSSPSRYSAALPSWIERVSQLHFVYYSTVLLISILAMNDDAIMCF